MVSPAYLMKAYAYLVRVSGFSYSSVCKIFQGQLDQHFYMWMLTQCDHWKMLLCCSGNVEFL